MAHSETHEHHGASHHNADKKNSRTAFSSSFWFVIILVGLFIAAVNFIGAMNGDHDEKEGMVEPTMEATSNGTAAGESGLGKPMDKADTTQHHGSETPVDQANTEGH
jgi:hypothetical protein